MLKLFKTFIVIFLLIYFNSYAQEDLGTKIVRVGKTYAAKYIEPLNDAFGANFNSGFFNTAYVPFEKEKPTDFNISLSLKYFGTFLSENDESFNLTYTDTVERYPGQFELATYHVTNAPTIIGSTQAPIAIGVYNSGGDAPVDTLIGGIVNTNIIPFVALQIGLGTVYGTDAALRFFPHIRISDYGSFGLVGFAIRHNVSQYFENLPVDMAVQFGYQYFNIKDNKDENIVGSKSFLFNAQVSRNLSKLLIIYGGLQYESFSSNYEYTYKSKTGAEYNVSFEQTGDNKFRGILGLNLQLGVFNINSDINIGNKFVVSSGMGIGF